MTSEAGLKLAVGNLYMYAAERRMQLAKAHRAIANGAYGQRLTDLRNEVSRLEAELLAVGVRP